MTDDEDLDWYLVRIRCGQEAQVAETLAKACIRHLEPEFDKPRAAAAGRARPSGKVFPGHLFVAVSAGHGLLTRPSDFPGIDAVFRDEKGRPMCIDRDRVSELAAYCRAATPEDVPAGLDVLDRLHDGERLDQFLDRCWGPPPTTVRPSGRASLPALD